MTEWEDAFSTEMFDGASIIEKPKPTWSLNFEVNKSSIADVEISGDKKHFLRELLNKVAIIQTCKN